MATRKHHNVALYIHCSSVISMPVVIYWAETQAISEVQLFQNSCCWSHEQFIDQVSGTDAYLIPMTSHLLRDKVVYWISSWSQDCQLQGRLRTPSDIALVTQLFFECGYVFRPRFQCQYIFELHLFIRFFSLFCKLRTSLYFCSCTGVNNSQAETTIYLIKEDLFL
jgi:hypothetical protein